MASVSIDDIWDTPVEPSPPRAQPIDVDETPLSPIKKHHTTLFDLSDSDHDEEQPPEAGSSKGTSKTPVDIDALFGDLDEEEDNDGGFKELAPSLNLDALRRQADRQQAAKQPPPPKTAAPKTAEGSKSKAKGKGKDKDKDGEKPERKPIPRLDQARLLGPDGFPALVKQTKAFKPKGKGHETSDLNRIMNIYNFWSHKMFPKGQFKDTVQRVEKLCHSKRMHVALSVWQDESKGLVNGRKVDDPIDLTSDNEGDGSDTEEHADPEDQPKTTTNPSETQDVSADVPSTSKSTAMEIDDDLDFEAMMREAPQRQPTSTSIAEEPPSRASAATENMDEDEAMWAALGDGGFGDDVDIPKPDSGPTLPPPPHDLDEDEDMWDILDEMEEPGKQKPTPSGTAVESQSKAAGPAATVELPPVEEGPRPTSEEGWDEMYL